MTESKQDTATDKAAQPGINDLPEDKHRSYNHQEDLERKRNYMLEKLVFASLDPVDFLPLNMESPNVEVTPMGEVRGTIHY